MRRWIAKLSGRTEPQAHVDELLGLYTMAGRRCAHDLAHAADLVEDSHWNKIFVDKAKHWHTVFYPGSDGKNYRHHLHNEIARRDREIEELRELLAQHNIDARGITGTDFPF